MTRTKAAKQHIQRHSNGDITIDKSTSLTIGLVMALLSAGVGLLVGIVIPRERESAVDRAALEAHLVTATSFFTDVEKRVKKLELFAVEGNRHTRENHLEYVARHDREDADKHREILDSLRVLERAHLDLNLAHIQINTRLERLERMTGDANQTVTPRLRP